MGNLPLLVAAPKGNGASLQSVRLKSDFRFCDNCDLALEADHRIANHLAMLASYVGMKQRDIQAAPGGETDASVLLAFEGIRTQIKAVASLHRSLATQQRGSPVDLAEYLHQVCSPFMLGLSGAIELTEDLRTGCLVRSEQILPLTQIISEVITNAIKYSHARGEPGKMSVNCHSLADSQLEIEIIDDGAGLPQAFDPLTAGGLGLRLIRALTGQVDAQSGFETSLAGTRFWLRLESARKARAR